MLTLTAAMDGGSLCGTDEKPTAFLELEAGVRNYQGTLETEYPDNALFRINHMRAHEQSDSIRFVAVLWQGYGITPSLVAAGVTLDNQSTGRTPDFVFVLV